MRSLLPTQASRRSSRQRGRAATTAPSPGRSTRWPRSSFRPPTSRPAGASSMWRPAPATQREFVRELAHKNGYWVDWSKLSREELYEASDVSFMRGENTLFEELLKRAIEAMG